MAQQLLELDLIYHIKDVKSPLRHVLRNEFMYRMDGLNVYVGSHDIAFKINKSLDERNNQFFNLSFIDKSTLLMDNTSSISLLQLFRPWIGKLIYEELVEIKEGTLRFIKNSYILEESEWIPEKIYASETCLIIFDLNQFKFLTNECETIVDTLNETKVTSFEKYQDFVFTQEFETKLEKALKSSELDEEYVEQVLYAFRFVTYDEDTSTMARIIAGLQSFSDSCRL